MVVLLETERLILRRFTEADADLLLVLESDPEVLRYVGRGPLGDVDAYREKIRSRNLRYYERRDGFGGWAVIEKETGEFIGGCGLKSALDSRDAASMNYGPDETELGYGLRQASWNKGYATELARALVRIAFTELGAVRIVACVNCANVASVRVLEKAGLKPIGEPVVMQGEELPCVKYMLSKERFDREHSVKRIGQMIREKAFPLVLWE